MLDLAKLRHVIALSHRRNFARAAEDLGISQPALTRSIQALEQQLGMRLFDRDRSGVNLTPQGRDFADRAAVLVANAEDLETHAAQTAIGRRGRVRFGMAPMPARALLSDVLQARLVEATGLIYDVVVRNVAALWPLLTAGEIEFFVSAEGQVPDTPPVRAVSLGVFPVSFLVRKGHPLLTEPETSERFPIVISSRRDVALPPRLQGRTFDQPHVIEDFGTLAALTGSTNAIWISSVYAAVAELAGEILVELPVSSIPGRQEYRMVMYSLDRRTQSPAALALQHNFARRISHFKEAARAP
jgi:DNA-binding transcriptional LysR family regulator